jgi:hypothetical protein
MSPRIAVIARRIFLFSSMWSGRRFFEPRTVGQFPALDDGKANAINSALARQTIPRKHSRKYLNFVQVEMRRAAREPVSAG